MKRAKRKKPEVRRELILEAAIALAKKEGYHRITRDAVARRAEISSALIATYYPRMVHLKTAVLDAAIDREIVEIVAQGLSLGVPRALRIGEGLRQKVTTYLFTLK